MFFLRGFIDPIVAAAVAVLDDDDVVVVVVAMREVVFDTKKESSRSKKEGSSCPAEVLFRVYRPQLGEGGSGQQSRSQK